MQKRLNLKNLNQIKINLINFINIRYLAYIVATNYRLYISFYKYFYSFLIFLFIKMQRTGRALILEEEYRKSDEFKRLLESVKLYIARSCIMSEIKTKIKKVN